MKLLILLFPNVRFYSVYLSRDKNERTAGEISKVKKSPVGLPADLPSPLNVTPNTRNKTHYAGTCVLDGGFSSCAAGKEKHKDKNKKRTENIKKYRSGGAPPRA